MGSGADMMLITEPKAHYGVWGASSEVARLFARETTEREAGMVELTALGSPVIPALIAVAVRPLGYALTEWPEWQQMLPPKAIMARCDSARRAALTVLEKMGRPAVRDLSPLLQSDDAELRGLAAEALAHIQDPEAVAVLGTLLSREISQARQFQFRWLTDFRVSGSLCILLTGISLGCLFPQAIVAIIAGVGLFLCSILLNGKANTALPVRKSAVCALAKSRDPRYIGTLAACLSDPDPCVRQFAVCGLTQILPLARVQHREYIEADAMAVLLRALDGENTELAIAVLNAMQQLGDMRALHHVAFLIDSPVHFASVRRAAETCLPYVKMRIKEAHLAQQLLRPATQGAVVLKELLCPLQGEEPIV